MATHHRTELPFGTAIGIILDANDLKELSPTKSRVLLVLDPQKEKPILKFPGGRPNPDDGGPLATARRELEEECGFVVHVSDTDPYFDLPQHDHFQRYYLLSADLGEAPAQGDENGHPLIVVTDHTLGEILRGEIGILGSHMRGLQGLCKKLKEAAL